MWPSGGAWKWRSQSGKNRGQAVRSRRRSKESGHSRQRLQRPPKRLPFQPEARTTHAPADCSSCHSGRISAGWVPAPACGWGGAHSFTSNARGRSGPAGRVRGFGMETDAKGSQAEANGGILVRSREAKRESPAECEDSNEESSPSGDKLGVLGSWRRPSRVTSIGTALGPRYRVNCVMTHTIIPAAYEVCVTSRCNLRCLHCYQHADKNKYTLPYQCIKPLVDIASTRADSVITFSGGEFFLHPQAYEILRYSADKPLLNFSVNTNGTVINRKELSGLPVDRLSFGISIDGFEADHDERRGPGTFAEALKAADHLKNDGFSVSAAVTLDSTNARYLGDFLGFLATRFSSVALICIGASGAALMNRDKLGVDDPFLSRVVRLLYGKLSKRTPHTRCGTFPFGVSVNYDGTVFPCSLARDLKVLPIGSLLEGDLPTLLQRFRSTAVGEEFCAYKSNDDLCECTSCSFNRSCPSGCRIRARQWHGSILAPDPFACMIYGKLDGHALSDVYWGRKVPERKYYES